MRKILLLLTFSVALGATAAAGTAAPPRGAVTIKATPSVVVFGNTVTLSGRITGRVSSSTSSQTVEILAKPFGATSISTLASVSAAATATTAGGAFTFVAKPTIETKYAARFQGQTSNPVTVHVRPAITLTQVSMSNGVGTFSTTVTAARSFAGKFVVVERLGRGHRLLMRKVVLGSNSSATFQLRFHRGHGHARLRVVMPASQAAPGYITGFSNVLTISR
jgi:hypothetical protein